MNAKVCKRLRRAAERASVGLRARGLVGKEVVVARGNRRWTTNIAINAYNTTRGIYRAMKREVERTKGTV